MTPLSRRSALFLGLGMPALLSACASTSAPPAGPADPTGLADPEMKALLESLAGFYGSQMTAMDNATRNAGDMINRLSIQYNRTRQAAITTELVEIISGAEAL